MKKLVIAAVALATFVTSVSEAEVLRYDFFNENNSVSGYFLQDRENNALLYFDIVSSTEFLPVVESDKYTSNVYAETTSFYESGPTNMSLWRFDAEGVTSRLNIMFSSNDQYSQGTYNFTANLDQSAADWSTYKFDPISVTFTGQVYESIVPGNNWSTVAVGTNPTNYILPNYNPTSVPEPASLALFGLGLFGIFRKTTKK